MSVNLRDLTREFFAGTLEGEADTERIQLNEACGCGTAPDSPPDLPQFINVDPMGGGIMGARAASHNSLADENLVAELDRISTEMYSENGGCLTSIVSAISHMLAEGVAPSDARAVWDALFVIAQGGNQDAY